MLVWDLSSHFKNFTHMETSTCEGCKIDIYLKLIAISYWRFLCVPHLLWPVLPSVWQWTFTTCFNELDLSRPGFHLHTVIALTDCATTAAILYLEGCIFSLLLLFFFVKSCYLKNVNNVEEIVNLVFKTQIRYYLFNKTFNIFAIGNYF